MSIIGNSRGNEEILYPYQTIVLAEGYREEVIKACLTNKQSIAGNVITIRTLHVPIPQSLVWIRRVPSGERVCSIVQCNYFYRSGRDADESNMWVEGIRRHTLNHCQAHFLKHLHPSLLMLLARTSCTIEL